MKARRAIRAPRGPERLEGTFLSGDDEYVVFSTPLVWAGALTAAEEGVIGMLLAGHRYRAIATARQVSTSTISNQVQSAFRKLGVHSVGELLARLHEH